MSAIAEVVDEIDTKIENVRRSIRSAISEGDVLVGNNWLGASMTLEQYQRVLDNVTASALSVDTSIRKIREQQR
ncbi:hypothetical protein ABZ805_29015 [Saccharopolyspora sp. NPDC047091]|uniref:hypothetical protein n=1 Tax=Saccharopolyspora sp. NPDC047091 TaxID=3155924 RepID=UPI0033DCA08A